MYVNSIYMCGRHQASYIQCQSETSWDVCVSITVFCSLDCPVDNLVPNLYGMPSFTYLDM